jgi:hypothetical protein
MLSLVPNVLMQIHPDEAITNFSEWLKRLGLPSPAWLHAKNSPGIIRWICGVLTAVSIGWLFWPKVIQWTYPKEDTKKYLWVPPQPKTISAAKGRRLNHKAVKTESNNPKFTAREQELEIISDFYGEGVRIQHDCVKMEEDGILGTRADDWARRTENYLYSVDKFYAARFAGALNQPGNIMRDGRNIPELNNNVWHSISTKLTVLEDMRKELRE